MDPSDSAQNQAQTQASVPSESVVQQPAPVAPMGAVSGPNKETSPLTRSSEPLIRPSEEEPQLSSEVKEAGVEVSPNPEVPNLTYEDKKAGLSHAKESTPVATEPSGLVQAPFPTPMTLVQAEEVIKKDKNTNDSKLWLSTLIRKLFRQFDVTEKKAA